MTSLEESEVFNYINPDRDNTLFKTLNSDSLIQSIKEDNGYANAEIQEAVIAYIDNLKSTSLQLNDEAIARYLPVGTKVEWAHSDWIGLWTNVTIESSPVDISNYNLPIAGTSFILNITDDKERVEFAIINRSVLSRYILMRDQNFHVNPQSSS